MKTSGRLKLRDDRFISLECFDRVFLLNVRLSRFCLGMNLVVLQIVYYSLYWAISLFRGSTLESLFKFLCLFLIITDGISSLLLRIDP